MNFNFTHQLLFCSTSLEGCFLDDFSCCNSFRITLHKFIAFSESTFSKKFTFDILSVAYLTILMFYSFFNNLCTRSLILRMKIGLTATMLTSGNNPRSCSSTSSRTLRLSATMKLILTTIVIRHIKKFYILPKIQIINN